MLQHNSSNVVEKAITKVGFEKLGPVFSVTLIPSKKRGIT
jgi:hypothetical protein